MYQTTLDKAAFGMLSGVYDYNTTIKRAVKELTDSGLRTVDYETGWSNRVEVAARRAIMTGFNQVVGRITEENAEKLGATHFEVTYHQGARPTHQPWQGRVYTKEQLVTVCGYGEADGLKGANCRHDFHPFFPGISKRLYTDEQLDRMNAEENTPKEYNGKQYTTYEATQRQRKLETALRRKREEIALLEQGGADEDDVLALKAKYHALSSEYVQFSKAMNLPQQRERISVDGFGGVDTSFGKAAETEVKTVEKHRANNKPLSPHKAKTPINGIDVKAEYERNATPGKGKITYDEGYNVEANKNEVKFAEWLYEKFGGNIHLLQTSEVEGVKMPDYIWNGKLWDLKSTTTEKAADSAIRKGCKQIQKNPGGIFLNYGELKINIEQLNKIINSRMSHYKGKELDVFVVNNNEVIEVLRYKK